MGLGFFEELVIYVHLNDISDFKFGGNLRTLMIYLYAFCTYVLIKKRLREIRHILSDKLIQSDICRVFIYLKASHSSS